MCNTLSSPTAVQRLKVCLFNVVIFKFVFFLINKRVSEFIFVCTNDLLSETYVPTKNLIL